MYDVRDSHFARRSTPYRFRTHSLAPGPGALDTRLDFTKQSDTVKKQLASCSSAAGNQYARHATAEGSLNLDLSKIPIDSHWSELLRAFDAVGPGQSLAVVGVTNCGRTLRQLQSQRPSACEWISLSQTSLGIRVELRRRLDTQPASVSEQFGSDHERLHASLARVIAILRTGALATAREQGERFRMDVEKHIDAEESVLFPLMEQAYGLAVRDRTVMGAEHGMIRERSVALASMLRSAGANVCINAALELSELLARHSMKEERILYPMLDRWIGDQQGRRELVRHALDT